MTKEDIIDMAREAGFVEYELDDGTTNAFDVRYERFYNLAAAAEREACAKLCLETEPFYGVMFYNAIRARGNT